MLDLACRITFDPLRLDSQALLIFLKQVLRTLLRRGEDALGFLGSRVELRFILLQPALRLGPVTLGLVQTVLDLLLPLFENAQDAGEGIFVEHKQQDGEGDDLPEDQGREKMRFKLRHINSPGQRDTGLWGYSPSPLSRLPHLPL